MRQSQVVEENKKTLTSCWYRLWDTVETQSRETMAKYMLDMSRYSDGRSQLTSCQGTAWDDYHVRLENILWSFQEKKGRWVCLMQVSFNSHKSLLIVYSCMTDVGTSRQENQKMEGGDIYEESRHSSCKTTKGHEKKTFKLCGKFSFWYQTSNQTWEATKCKSLRSSQATRFCTTTKWREKISVYIYQCHLLLWENHF